MIIRVVTDRSQWEEIWTNQNKELLSHAKHLCTNSPVISMSYISNTREAAMMLHRLPTTHFKFMYLHA